MAMVKLMVNGRHYTVDVGVKTTLLEVLRDKLQITSPKTGCNTGDCGTCSVLLDGKLVRACLTNANSVEGCEVVTAEGMARKGEFHPLQNAFHEKYASQCGFCSPGMLMAAKALLDENPTPTREEVKEAISGNLCRCSGYVKIIDAVMSASQVMSKTEAQ